jgi:DNA-binding response OmpR family regulator/DNA-binding CsgD family transcriptional regulator
MKKNRKILIVDDLPQNIFILREALQDQYELAAALNGKKALEWLGENRPDLILLDIMMPDINGYELCRTIQEMPPLKGTPVIFITALNETENKTRGFESGAVDYILKPFDTDEVKSRIQLHLELKEYRDNLLELVTEKTRHLEESNIALKVLIRNMAAEKKAVEEKVLFNVRELVLPYLRTVTEKGSLSDIQKKNMAIAMDNLNQITASFLPQEIMTKGILSPQEIKVANLIKQGKTSKEIADLVRLTPRTIESYRNTIRKKLGIGNKKVNLHTYLSTMAWQE